MRRRRSRGSGISEGLEDGRSIGVSHRCSFTVSSLEPTADVVALLVDNPVLRVGLAFERVALLVDRSRLLVDLAVRLSQVAVEA